MWDAYISAVDVSGDVVAMGEAVKKGEAVPWSEVGRISLNPGRPNSDFSEPERIRNGLNVLERLGCLENLGAEFTETKIQVAPDVRERVNFVHSKALEALNGPLAAVRPDFIGAFFVLLNINKDPVPARGVDYSYDLVNRALDMLDSQGILMVGDTSLNLPKTLTQIAESTKGNLNLAGMVHMVNFGKGVTSSHYVVASQMEPFPEASRWLGVSRRRILANPLFSETLQVQETSTRFSEGMGGRSQRHLNIGFVGFTRGERKCTTWESEIPGVAEAIKQAVPNSGDEVSEDTVFRAQKPHLRRFR
jgi:hypothetical protein